MSDVYLTNPEIPSEEEGTYMVRTIQVLYRDKDSGLMADAVSDALSEMVGDGILDYAFLYPDEAVEEQEAIDRFPDAFAHLFNDEDEEDSDGED